MPSNSAMYYIIFSINNMMQEITNDFQSSCIFIPLIIFPLWLHLYRVTTLWFYLLHRTKIFRCGNYKAFSHLDGEQNKEMEEKTTEIIWVQELDFLGPPRYNKTSAETSCILYLRWWGLYSPHQMMTKSLLAMCFHYTALRSMPQKTSDVLWRHTSQIILMHIHVHIALLIHASKLHCK